MIFPGAGEQSSAPFAWRSRRLRTQGRRMSAFDHNRLFVAPRNPFGPSPSTACLQQSLRINCIFRCSRSLRLSDSEGIWPRLRSAKGFDKLSPNGRGAEQGRNVSSPTIAAIRREGLQTPSSPFACPPGKIVARLHSPAARALSGCVRCKNAAGSHIYFADAKRACLGPHQPLAPVFREHRQRSPRARLRVAQGHAALPSQKRNLSIAGGITHVARERRRWTYASQPGHGVQRAGV
jgi:hypothetical protein